MRWHLWNALLAVLIGGAILAMCGNAQAQTVCRRWTDGYGLDLEGTPAEGCAGSLAAFLSYAPGRAPASVTACVYSGGSLTATVTFSNPTESGVPLVITDAGPCASDPGEGGGGTVDPFTDNQSLNLLTWGFLVLLFGLGLGVGRLR